MNISISEELLQSAMNALNTSSGYLRGDYGSGDPMDEEFYRKNKELAYTFDQTYDEIKKQIRITKKFSSARDPMFDDF